MAISSGGQAQGGTGAQVPIPPSGPNTGSLPSGPTKINTAGLHLPKNADSGWYVFIGVSAGFLTANSRIAPYVMGILSVALIFQLGQLLRGNYSYG